MKLQTVTQSEIEKVATVKEAAQLKQVADAAAIFYKAQEDLVASQQAKEMSLRSARRAGIILLPITRENGHRTSLHVKRGSTQYQEALEGTGITPFVAQTWQKLAQVSDEVFEEYVTTAKFLHTEFTINGLLRFSNGSKEAPAKEVKRCECCGQIYRKEIS